MRFVILRTPEYGQDVYKRVIELIEKLGHELVGFIAFDKSEEFTSLENYPIYPLSHLSVLECDKFLLAASLNKYYLLKPAILKVGIPNEKLSPLFYVLQLAMEKKYEDILDPTIQKTLSWWKNHDIDVFNQHMDGVKDTLHEIHIDEKSGLPYINFESIGGKVHRMYYPKDAGEIQEIEGKKYIPNILREQTPNSPHLYITKKHKIDDGDILIDAGVCEGNFALRHIDIVSKVYLFEPDARWLEPLHHTFDGFGDKVEFVSKFVSDVSKGYFTTVDDVIGRSKGKNYFLKMDIEGAEPAALRGAKKLLTENKVKVSACAYHNSFDAVEIKSLLQSYGYKTSTGNGFMVFLYDPNIWQTMDFRKGMVYGEN